MSDEFNKAVMFGNLEKVQQMVSSNPEIVNEKDEFGFTALHHVMSEDPNPAAKFILENGANPNSKNEDGIAPLHLACHVENAKLLIEHGANIDLQSNREQTPLHVHAAEGSKSFEVIQFLLESGADATLTDDDDRTPVEISKSRQDSDVVELFEIWSDDSDSDFDFDD